MNVRRGGSIFGSLLTVVACSSPTGPGAVVDTVVAHGLRLTLSAVPETVMVGDSFRVGFSLTNVTNLPVKITTSYTCLFFLVTFRGESSFPLQGSGYACGAAFTDHVYAAGDSIGWSLWLRAAPALADSMAATFGPGTYTVRTQMNADLPKLEVAVEVVDSS